MWIEFRSILINGSGFAENLIIVANPSKSGGDWWYGKVEATGKSGLFPKTYVDVVQSSEIVIYIFVDKVLSILIGKAKAIYSYIGNNADELTFNEGDTVEVVDTSDEEWWKAEQGGTVYVAPAAYLELDEG